MVVDHIKRGLNPKFDLCISKIELVTTIFEGQGTAKSCYLKIFKSQWIFEILAWFFACDHKFYRSHGALSLIAGGWPKWPPPAFSWKSEKIRDDHSWVMKSFVRLGPLSIYQIIKMYKRWSKDRPADTHVDILSIGKIKILGLKLELPL